MLLQKFKRFLRSCNELGVKQTGLIIKHRMQRNRFVKHMRAQALNHSAQHTWHALSKKYNLSLDVLCKQTLPYIDPLYASLGEKQLHSLTNRYTQHQFQALGSDWYQLNDTMWHTDIRLKQQGGGDCLFDATAFYADIQIESGQAEALNKDIKVPWELSRLQQLPLLAQAYQREPHATYSKTFMFHVEHWRIHNPYLLGINWVCPMEVALRSISLVIAFDGFKHVDDIPSEFWQNYTALLYDHMVYLEHNWEWYDGRTSNHYLSDLVGYLYLCWFFQSCADAHKKINWCVQEILRECSKQVFAEGTSYEGSTRYHVLVTELLYHVELLSAALHITLPQSFHQKLARMFNFIDWCTINEMDMITIGDHDGGKVTWPGLPQASAYTFNESRYIKEFNQFGLSILKTDTWHVSLRHHVYNNKQPSGHYHNDAGSITLAIRGIPVLVDPGSYVYTASGVWRNRFRSAAAHTVMSIVGQEPVPFDERLFALNIPQQECRLYNDEHSLSFSHRLYEPIGLRYERNILVHNNAIEIKDIWRKSSHMQEGLDLFFNLAFGHGIVMQKEGDCWVGSYNDEPLFKLETFLALQKEKGYVASSYGSKSETIFLCVRMPVKVDKEYVCRFTLL